MKSTFFNSFLNFFFFLLLMELQFTRFDQTLFLDELQMIHVLCILGYSVCQNLLSKIIQKTLNL